jgi:phosphorylase kinase gamma subunit
MISLIDAEVCGTPGYLAPELLKAAMFEDSKGYYHAVDVLVLSYFHSL